MIEPSDLEVAVRGLARSFRILERASDELSFADYRMLAAVDDGEERAARLADRLAVGKPTVSATVDSLVKRGLLSRSKVEGDNRASALALTPDGADVLGRMRTRMTRQLELLTERSDDPEAIVHALMALDDAVEAAVAERWSREQKAAVATA